MSTEHTLLLNASYEAIDVIHWQRAMVLWAQDKVEIIKTHDREVRSVGFSFKLPSVVRLYQYIKTKRREQVQFTRANIYTRDNYTCQYCAKQFQTADLTFDHVIPNAKGGARRWENIVTCCLKCNRQKGCRTPEEAGMKLLHTPKQPTYSPLFRVATGAAKNTPDSWRDYLYWHATLEKS